MPSVRICDTRCMDQSGDQIRVALAGDKRAAEDAFTELYGMHANSIYRFCFRATANWALAEDLTAQVFLEAWRKRSSMMVTGDGSLLPWLYGVATHLLRNQRRGERRRQHMLGRWSEPLVEFGFEDQAVERLDDEREMRRLLATLETLPIADRELLRLAIWEKLTSAEIAIVLGISPGAVRTRLTRAKQRLKHADSTPAVEWSINERS